MAAGKYQRWLEPDGLILIEGWARRGLTEKQIAHNMRINVKTLREWKRDHPPICTAIKKGKEVTDLEVEGALYKSAIGYDVTEITEERMFDKKSGTFKMVPTKRITKHVAPNVSAQIFWLKNRRPDLWRNKQEVDVSADLRADQAKLDDLVKQMQGGDAS